jgi:electron transfer flavoprotein beta subunit
LLIIALVKGVPSRSTKVVRVDNIVQRNEMEMIVNPNDEKAIEAADYLKRRVGGKIVTLSMGPDVRLKPVLMPLYNAEATGVDEEMILSDPRLAGSDTVATSYAVGLAVFKIYEKHITPFDALIKLITGGSSMQEIEAKARELYDQNVLPNKVYNVDPGDRTSIIGHLVEGNLSRDEAVARLKTERANVTKFVIVAGIRTSDGETGSVGPQVAEVVSQKMGIELPHATYVEELDVDPDSLRIHAGRRIGRSIQRLEMESPVLMTFAPEYVAKTIQSVDFDRVIENYYKGKVKEPIKWTADILDADPARLGFGGSAVIVGPAIMMGAPSGQKTVGKSMVFTTKVEKTAWEGKEYGPFEKGDVADALPQTLKDDLTAKGGLTTFTLDMLGAELLA